MNKSNICINTQKICYDPIKKIKGPKVVKSNFPQLRPYESPSETM